LRENEQLIGRIQERYGIAKDEAQHQVDEWHRTQDAENEHQRERNLHSKAS